ncbi:MAG: helix-turn-helix domain-containing protein [bacterium]
MNGGKYYPDILTIEGMAEVLDVSVRTIRRMIKSGKIRNAKKIGKRWLIRYQDLVSDLFDPEMKQKEKRKEGKNDGL